VRRALANDEVILQVNLVVDCTRLLGLTDCAEHSLALRIAGLDGGGRFSAAGAMTRLGVTRRLGADYGTHWTQHRGRATQEQL
jgi:hypothetical protein